MPTLLEGILQASQKFLEGRQAAEALKVAYQQQAMQAAMQQQAQQSAIQTAALQRQATQQQMQQSATEFGSPAAAYGRETTAPEMAAATRRAVLPVRGEEGIQDIGLRVQEQGAMLPGMLAQRSAVSQVDLAQEIARDDARYEQQQRQDMDRLQTATTLLPGMAVEGRQWGNVTMSPTGIPIPGSIKSQTDLDLEDINATLGLGNARLSLEEQTATMEMLSDPDVAARYYGAPVQERIAGGDTAALTSRYAAEGMTPAMVASAKAAEARAQQSAVDAKNRALLEQYRQESQNNRQDKSLLAQEYLVKLRAQLGDETGGSSSGGYSTAFGKMTPTQLRTAAQKILSVWQTDDTTMDTKSYGSSAVPARLQAERNLRLGGLRFDANTEMMIARAKLERAKAHIAAPSSGGGPPQSAPGGATSGAQQSKSSIGDIVQRYAGSGPKSSLTYKGMKFIGSPALVRMYDRAQAGRLQAGMCSRELQQVHGISGMGDAKDLHKPGHLDRIGFTPVPKGQPLQVGDWIITTGGPGHVREVVIDANGDQHYMSSLTGKKGYATFDIRPAYWSRDMVAMRPPASWGMGAPAGDPNKRFTTSDVFLRTAPGGGTARTVLTKGMTVWPDWNKTQGNYIMVKTPSGSGWVDRRFLKGP